MVEYLYSVPDGSFIQLERVFNTDAFIVHCDIVTHVTQVAVVHHVYTVGDAGIGITQATAWRNSSPFLMFVVSDNLTESRAEPDCDENDRNAIVARIARITITTISSTSVNALFILIIILEFNYKLLF
jgi:hypothetical protein